MVGPLELCIHVRPESFRGQHAASKLAILKGLLGPLPTTSTGPWASLQPSLLDAALCYQAVGSWLAFITRQNTVSFPVGGIFAGQTP